MNSFWHIDVGNIATWVGVVLTLAAFAGRFVRRWDTRFISFENLSTHLSESFKALGDSFEKLSVRVDNIDATGTRFSRAGIERETELTKSNTRRLDIHDGILAKVSPDMAAIRTDLDWIKDEIRKAA